MTKAGKATRLRHSVHTRNFRRMVAFHEAGHAVVARKLGVEGVRVYMARGDKYLAS